MRNLVELFQDTEQLGVAAQWESECIAIKWKLRRQESLLQQILVKFVKTKCDGSAATECCWSDRLQTDTTNSVRSHRMYPTNENSGGCDHFC